jgi:hypothetical protein
MRNTFDNNYFFRIFDEKTYQRDFHQSSKSFCFSYKDNSSQDPDKKILQISIVELNYFG